MMRMTDVVKNLLMINVIVFFGVRYLIPIPGIERFFILIFPGKEYFDASSEMMFGFEPVQIVTHIFMHGDERHLLFNMLALYFLGPMTEASLGPKRFLLLYLTSGFVASVAQMVMTQGAIVGASGAVYGVLAGFATMFPNMQMMLLFPPIPIKAKYMAIGLIAIGLFSGFSGMQAGIGHFAHVGGAICGFLLVHYWKMANLR
jgi:membrane associated rhomboid family serine protease